MAYKFNHTKFLDSFRAYHNELRQQKFTTSQVAGLEFLLTQIENDSIWQRVEHIAYALATVMHETAFTMQPISEYGGFAYFEKRYGYQTKVGKRLGNDAPGDGAKYHGRGNVQLTGETNYERLEIDLRKHYPHLIAEFEAETGQTFDLTDYPEQAKNPIFAYAIMAFGMYNGRFTGKSFNDFSPTNFTAMRTIINGTDKAKVIAGYAVRLLQLLKASLENTNATPVAFVPQTTEPISQQTQLPVAPQDLATPVQIEKVQPVETGATTAFEAIQKYGKTIAKSTGITSFGGAVAFIVAKVSGVNIDPEILTYIILAVIALVILVVIFGGAALVVYVIARFVLTGVREQQAFKLNLAQIESVSRNDRQAVTFIGG